MHSSFFDERIRMYRYYFKLANLVIQINAPFVIEKFYEMEIYRIEYAAVSYTHLRAHET